MADSQTLDHSSFGVRNAALDAIKGLCIILMVVGHSGAPKGLVEMISCFHMPAFFIISGFLFKEKYLEDMGGFVSRKLRTIWWPYVLWSLIFIIGHNLLYSIHFYVNEYSLAETGGRMIKAVLMRSTENLLGGFWFLTSLLWASLAALLYLKLIRPTVWSLSAGIAVALGIAFSLKMSWLPTVWYFNANNFQAIAFFLTGILFARQKWNLISRKWPVVVAALISVTIGTFWIKGSILTVTAPMLPAYYLTASLITWGLILVFWKSNPDGWVRYLVKIGARTLDILIFHFLSFKLVTLLRYYLGSLPSERIADFPVPGFPSIGLQNDYYWILYSIVGLAIPLLISLLLDYPRRHIRWL